MNLQGKIMRKPFELQERLDRPPILDVVLNLKCRDEIIPILRALQHVYSQPSVRDSILDLIARDVNKTTSGKRGRPGLNYWEILVLACVRLGCNLDYDKLQDLAENHRTLRHIMGIGDWSPEGQFDWRRICDNLDRLQPETIERISHCIVSEGHKLDPNAAKTARGDSFVVQTNIHYPTDSSLIGDGLRKILEIASPLAAVLNVKGWRQHKHLHKKLKKILRDIDKVAKSKGRHCQGRLKEAYQVLFDLTDDLLERALELLQTIQVLFPNGTMARVDLEALRCELEYFVDKTEHVCWIAKRRILNGEKVPKEEKLFSLFEPHTELINRGKRPNPNEFGHRVLIVEDGAGFICHHKVMEIGEQDLDVLIPEMERLQERLGGKIERGSFDRGFHSPKNQEDLKRLLTHPCLAARGKRKEAQQEQEATVEFRQARQSHPGVESAIGALQSGNGLDRCRDRTFRGYKRYIALGVLGRNLHVLGKLLIAKSDPEAVAGKSQRRRAA